MPKGDARSRAEVGGLRGRGQERRRPPFSWDELVGVMAVGNRANQSKLQALHVPRCEWVRACRPVPPSGSPGQVCLRRA